MSFRRKGKHDELLLQAVVCIITVIRNATATGFVTHWGCSTARAAAPGGQPSITTNQRTDALLKKAVQTCPIIVVVLRSWQQICHQGERCRGQA